MKRKPVKLNEEVIRQAKTVAAVRGIPMAEYLESKLAKRVAADFKKATGAAK